MRLFLNWLCDNRAALIISTAIFVAMAVIMGLMVNQDILKSLGDLFANYSERAVSPFLWVWRGGGAIAWPTFFVLLLYRFRNPQDPKGILKLVVVALAGMLYGGFGMWGLTEAMGLLLERMSGQGIGIVMLFIVFVEVVSCAYTWGFCAIYALGLKSLTGRTGNAWVLPAIGFSALGRYIGQFLISLAVSLVLTIVIQIMMLASDWDSLVLVLPIAVSLCIGNFAGQWPSFWKTHDGVLGIRTEPRMPAYPTAYPAGTPVQYGYPAGQPSPQAYPQAPAPTPAQQPPYAGTPADVVPPQPPAPQYPYPGQPPEGNPPA